MKKKVLAIILPLLITATATQASVDLIAIGQVDGNYQDLSTKTAGALENGIAGNRLGGTGSGLAYAGNNTFLALPDRGPNATPYNPLVDDTTSYIPRFQTFNLSLAVNPNYDATVIGSMPYILSPYLTATTLLSSSWALNYGVSGKPALNVTGKSYYSGRSDNFNAKVPSTSPFNGRLDPEGIRVSNDGKSVFITDEYGPYIYQFTRNNGRFLKTFKLPNHYAAPVSKSTEKDITNADGTIIKGEISSNATGRISNKGMEALAISPDGSTLIGMMQQNLSQDTKKYVRIIKITIATGAMHEYVYKLTDGSSVSDILAINDHEFLVDERDGAGLGDGSAAVVKKLYKIDLSTATEINGVYPLVVGTQYPALTNIPVVTKTLFVDVLAKLTAAGISATEVPAKIEGAAFGPDITIGGVTKHTLFIANDNDFLPVVGGVNNPNKFFVFSVDSADVPNFVPQAITPHAIDNGERN